MKTLIAFTTFFFGTLAYSQIALDRLDYKNPIVSLGQCGGTVHLSFANDSASVQSSGSNCNMMTVGKETRTTDHWTLPLNTELDVMFRNESGQVRTRGVVRVSTLAPGASPDPSATPIPNDISNDSPSSDPTVRPQMSPGGYQSTPVTLPQ